MALVVWGQVVTQLGPTRVLTLADGYALGRYCDAFVRWREAADFLDANGSTYIIRGADESPKCVMPFPQVAIYSKLASLLSRLEAEFGLTPSSRSRISVSNPDDGAANSKTRFFNAG
jgi:P27 family predicted phage terminase small subunit